MKARFVSFLMIILVGMVAGLWAQPPAGYEGFPTIDGGDGRFFAFTRGASSLGDSGGAVVALSICVDGTTETILSVWLYDGEIGGLWDQVGADAMTWELFADPTLAGNTAPGDLLDTVAAAGLTDDGWEEIINRPLDASALAADGNYYYHLVGSWDTETPGENEANRVKAAANGSVFLLPGSTIGFVGFGLLGKTFDGTFAFNANFPNDGTIPCSLTIFDGDADYGDGVTGFDDNDPTYGPGDIPGDTGIPGFPTSPLTLPEGVNLSDPHDDIGVAALEFPPDVFFTVTGPGASYVHNVPNPSGNQEWERTIIYSLNAACPPVPPAAPPFVDLFVADILPGTHQILFQGLDTGNTVFVNVNQASVGSPEEPVECDPDKELISLVFRYVGGDCSGTTNTQNGAFSCTGDPGTAPVSITEPAKATVPSPTSGIGVGDLITFTGPKGKLKSEIMFKVVGSGTQSLAIHTSCSKPLAVGDQFGSLVLVGMTQN